MPPFFDESIYKRSLKIMEKQYIEINCPINGIPFPEIVWFRNGRQLLFANNSNELHNNEDSNQLLLLNKNTVTIVLIFFYKIFLDND